MTEIIMNGLDQHPHMTDSPPEQHGMSRRDFLRTASGAAAASALGSTAAVQMAAADTPGAPVYFTRDISPAGLIKAYEACGRKLTGRTGVKISTGEPGGHHFLAPSLIAPLVSRLDGTIVECCTAYGGGRATPASHWRTIEQHGFKDIAPCDLMDEEGELSLPVEKGFHLRENIVGSHFSAYDSFVILSHFKGHAMGGFGGALKNISIGMASPRGKANIHTAGRTSDPGTLWSNLPAQDHFLESMADAVKAVYAAKGAECFVCVNVANNLSVDCDCDSHPAPPRMADIGIFASTDPVALDQTCYDAVFQSEDSGKIYLIERMTSRHGIHTVEAAARHGIGVTAYKLVSLD